jgi:ribosomal 50S subunit-recycling heat shock protein
MRLDLFLKASRLCPRRSLAQELCDAGFVLLNGRAAKPAHLVKAGDEISIRRRDHEVIVRVLQIPDKRNVSKDDSGKLVEIVSETDIESF